MKNSAACPQRTRPRSRPNPRFRPGPRLRRFLLLAVFAAGAFPLAVGAAAIGPEGGRFSSTVLAAATSAPASPQSGVDAASETKAPPEEASNPELVPEGEYLRSPMVRSLARRFGMSVDAASRTFELVNFALLVIGIVWLVARFLPKALRSRSERLRNELRQAHAAIENANRRLAAVEERLSRLDSEIEAIQKQAEEETRLEEQRLRDNMEREKQVILQSAAQDIHAAQRSAQNRLRKLAADLTIERATRQIAVTPELDRAIVSGFLAELNGNAHGNGAGARGRGAGAPGSRGSLEGDRA